MLDRHALLRGASHVNGDRSDLLFRAARLELPLLLAGRYVAAKTFRSPNFREKISLAVAMEDERSRFLFGPLVGGSHGRGLHINGPASFKILDRNGPAGRI